MLGAGFGNGDPGTRNTSLCLGTGFGGGVLVRSLALAPSVALASGATGVDDDAVRASTISVISLGAAAVVLMLAGANPLTLAGAAAAGLVILVLAGEPH